MDTFRWIISTEDPIIIISINFSLDPKESEQKSSEFSVFYSYKPF
jgi:hypothetical protein